LTDIAEIGFRADTSDLSDAKVKLDALSPSAKNAETASDKLMRKMDRLIGVMEKGTIKSSKQIAANDALAKSYARLETVMEGANRAAGVSGRRTFSENEANARAYGAALDKLRAKHNPLFAVIQKYKLNVKEVRQANHLGALSHDEMTEAIKRQRRAALAAIGAIKGNGKAVQKYGSIAGLERHNVANLAAQFQDVGVTAAAGMSPLTIAIQQGTQLSAVLGPLGLQGALRGLGAAFKSVFSPVSLLVIVVVALVAAGLQMLDWAKLAKNLLNGLADILPEVAKWATIAAAALALMYSPAILSAATKLPKLVGLLALGVKRLALGLLTILGIPGAIALGFVALIAAAVKFRDKLTQILGFDIVGAAKKGLNFIIGGFLGTMKGIIKTWSILPFAIADIMIQVANKILGSLKKVFAGGVKLINKFLRKIGRKEIEVGFDVDGDTIKNPLAGVAAEAGKKFGEEIDKALATDHLANIGAGIENVANKAANGLRKIAKGIGSDKDKDKVDKFANIVNRSKSETAKVNAQIAGLNLTSDAANRLKNETLLLNKARNAGLKLTPKQTEQLKQLAATLSDAQLKLKNLTGVKELTEAFDEQLTAVKAEAGAIGLTGQALLEYQAKTQLLADIKKKDIILTKEQTAALEKLAEKLASEQFKTAGLQAHQEMTKAANDNTRTLKDQIGAIGLVGEELFQYQERTRILAEIKAKDVKLTDDQTKALLKQGEQIAKLRAQQAAKTSFENQNAKLLESKATIDTEIQALGLNKEAANRLRFERKLLNDEIFRGIVLTDQDKQSLIANNDALFKSAEAFDKLKEKMEFVRGTAKGFFQDLIGGIKEGKSVWESFGNAVANVLDKIANRILDSIIDQLLNNLADSLVASSNS